MVKAFMKPLSQTEIEKYTALLSDVQKQFIEDYIHRGRKSKWLEQMSLMKGVDQNWELLQVLDGAAIATNSNTRTYKCECGQSIRWAYIVQNKNDQRKYMLGSTCISHYTGLPKKVVEDVLKGFHHIHLERDEILYQFANGFKQREIPFFVFEGKEMPEEIASIKKQMDLGLPLLHKQEQKLLNHPLIKEWFRQKEEEQRREAIKEQQRRMEELKKQRQDFIERQKNIAEDRKNQSPISNLSTGHGDYQNYKFIIENFLNDLRFLRKCEPLMNKEQAYKWSTFLMVIRKAKEGSLVNCKNLNRDIETLKKGNYSDPMEFFKNKPAFTFDFLITS